MDRARRRFRKFVRVTGVSSGRYVEFEFSVDDADLTVELILPLAAFEGFCTLQEAVRLPPADEAASELEKLAWRAHQPGLLRRVHAADDPFNDPTTRAPRQ